MADELQVSVSFTFTKNGATIQRSDAVSVTVAGNFAHYDIISVGTSDETLAKGDVGTVGFVYLKNLDTNNYIEFGTDGSAWPLKLKAGESQLVRWNATDVHAKANGSACRLEYAIVEN